MVKWNNIYYQLSTLNIKFKKSASESKKIEAKKEEGKIEERRIIKGENIWIKFENNLQFQNIFKFFTFS